jgi:PAS domain S-box-containing protein
MLSPDLARSALDSTPDAMVIVDASGTILFANHQVEPLFGYQREDLVGQNVDVLLPERFRPRHASHRERFAVDGRPRPMGQGFDLFARRRDGTEFPVEISLSPIRDSNGTLVAAAVRDVTDRKRIQAELMAARAAAEEAREVADRANQGKSRFLATASHDLRQPLQTLALLNGSLRRLIEDPDCLEGLVQQEQAISAMSRLLNALLDISKLESGAIKPEPTDFTVATLFEELRSEFATLAANKGLQFQVHQCTDRVHSDPALIEQILRNLVANAIKYTREGGVSLRCQHHKASVRIEVVDTGIGIPKDQLPYICDEFYQVGVPTNSVREGYGLGLSIVQRLVHLLKIGMHVESEVGRGSVFAIDLPKSMAAVNKPGAPASSGPRAATPSSKQLNILLVEDDAAVLAATRMLLRVEGFRVTAATSLAEAIRKASEHRDIDLLITDYHLSNGETGIQVISSLRNLAHPVLKAILVTGDTSLAMKEIQGDDNLRIASKPINADELLTMLRGLLAA